MLVGIWVSGPRQTDSWDLGFKTSTDGQTPPAGSAIEKAGSPACVSPPPAGSAIEKAVSVQNCRRTDRQTEQVNLYSRLVGGQVQLIQLRFYVNIITFPNKLINSCVYTMCVVYNFHFQNL